MYIIGTLPYCLRTVIIFLKWKLLMMKYTMYSNFLTECAHNRHVLLSVKEQQRSTGYGKSNVTKSLDIVSLDMQCVTIMHSSWQYLSSFSLRREKLYFSVLLILIMVVYLESLFIVLTKIYDSYMHYKRPWGVIHTVNFLMTL